MRTGNWTTRIAAIGLLIGLGLFIFSFRTVLNGPHEHRQADSVFSGYFYCIEPGSQFLFPHVGPRGETSGVAINEFPVYAYILGKICQIKGSWDETTPRVVSLLFALLAGLLFWKTLLKKFNLDPKQMGNGWVEFLMIFILLPVNWTFFSIPMPESTALFFYAVSAYLWTVYPKQKLVFTISAAFFLLGFLIRPFYILFLFFFIPSWIASVIILGLCIFLFWFWYRYWDSHVTTVPGYFGIHMETLSEILASVPRALAILPNRILGQTALVGLYSLYLIRKKYSWVVIFYLASIAMMYILKPTHVEAHAYYLLNAGLFASFGIFLSLHLMSPKQRNWFLVLFLVYSFSVTQHNFHSNGNWERTHKALEAHGPLPENAVVATYLGMSPQWLYFLKRTGYIFEPSQFNGTCPSKATQFLMTSTEPSAESPPPLVLKDCPSLQ